MMITNRTKPARLLDAVLGTSEGQIVTRLRLKRAASGTGVLVLRKRLAELKRGTEEYREVLATLGTERRMASLGNSTIQVPIKGGFAG